MSSDSASAFRPIVEPQFRLGDTLGFELQVVREDLLPFPLPGNKVRKLRRELQSASPGDVLISNGGIDSNHCRTLAIFGAQLGYRVHLVLHDDAQGTTASLALLDMLGASYEIVTGAHIAAALDRAEEGFQLQGLVARRISGGCHTPAGALAYREAGLDVIERYQPDVIVLASGTGATQGGLAAAAAGTSTRVVGVSVARARDRGREAVAEAAAWAGAGRVAVDFTEDFRDGGYGVYGEDTLAAVRIGWRYGLPVDPTYTGKAFRALLDDSFRERHLRGKRVIFWHTGGLFNAISGISRRTATPKAV